MMSCRWLCASLIAFTVAGFAVRGLADVSFGMYLRTAEVHNYQLTEPKLQAYDRVERHILSAKPTDPVVKALSQPVRTNAPLAELVQTLEKTPLKPLVESSGITVRDYLIVQIILKAAGAAVPYYEAKKRQPGNIISMENLTFYIDHEAEIKKMVREWSSLRAKQVQSSMVPAPKKN